MARLAVLALMLVARMALALTPEEQFCNCNDACCVINEINFNLESSVASGDDPFGSISEIYGNFSQVHYHPNVEKKNFNLFSFAGVTCTDSLAFLFETDGPAEPIAQVSLTQVDANTCGVNFSLALGEVDLRKDLTLFLAFKDMNDPLANLDLVIAALENIVPFTLPTHRWVSQTNIVDNSIVDVSLNIQILPDSGHTGNCLAASNAAEQRFQFIPAGSAPGTLANCLFTIDENIETSADRTHRMNYGFEQADYLRCYRQSENVGQLIRYTYEVVPDFTGCDYYEDASRYPSYLFTISLDNELNVNNTANVNSMILTTIDDSITIESCATENELPGVNIAVPTARLQFILEIQTAYGTEASSAVLSTLEFEDIGLEVVGDINYTTIAGSNTLISIRLQTIECLLVDTQHSAQPPTQANLVSCSIDYLQPLSLVATVTYQDGFTETNDVSGTERDISFSGNAAECANVIVPVSDVTQEFGARLVLEDLNGRTDSLNLNNPIVARVELTNFDLAETTGVSVVLSSIEFNLDDEYRRLYTASDKSQQMQVTFSPYYRDGHFCRYYESTTDVCSAFYQRVTDPGDYAANRWNAFLELLFDQGPSGFFIPDGAFRKYQGCQNRAVTGADSFIFTPSRWVFQSFPRTSGVLTAQAVAFLRVCTQGGTRRVLREIPLRLDASRLLQGTNDVVITIGNVSITSGSTLDIDVINSVTNAIDTPLMVALIVLVSVILALMCCFMMCKSAFCLRWYSAAKDKMRSDDM